MKKLAKHGDIATPIIVFCFLMLYSQTRTKIFKPRPEPFDTDPFIRYEKWIIGSIRIKIRTLPLTKFC
jgi:hypothetical protein